LKEGFMLKKSLIFGSAALFVAALITLTGCPTETESESGGSSGSKKNSLYGKMTAAQVQAVISKAKAVDETIYFEEGLEISDGAIDLSGARIVVNGRVETAQGVVINSVDADITWTGRLNLDSGDVYIFARGTTPPVPEANLVEFVTRLEDTQKTASKTAVKDFTFGAQADKDYSTGSPVDIPTKPAGGLVDVYVLGTVTIPLNAVNPSAAVKALGTVDVTGTNPIALTAYVEPYTSTTLTSSRGVTITLDAAAALPAVKVDQGKNITIKGAGTSLNIGKLDGNGTLIVEAVPATGDINIFSGTGNVTFTEALSSITGDINIYSTGKTTFKKDVKLAADDESIIVGDVVFEGAVTRGENPITFYGNVTLENTAGITLTGTEPISFVGTKSQTIYVGLTGAALEPVPILTAAKAELVPAAGAVLTTGPNLTSKPNEKTIAAAKKLVLSTAGLAIKSGSLEVVKDGVFEINAVTLTVTDKDDEVAGVLSIAEGGTILFVSTTSPAVNGKIDIEDTEIEGNSNSTLTAAGGTVSLANDVISGNASGAALAVNRKQAATIKVVKNTKLTLEQVNLDLSVAGIVSLEGDNSGTPGKLYLTKGSKVALSTATDGAALENKNISGTGGTASPGATNNGSIEGDVTVVGASNLTLYSLTHNGGQDVELTAGTIGTVNVSKATKLVK
jgi:hypothetical protein